MTVVLTVSVDSGVNNSVDMTIELTVVLIVVLSVVCGGGGGGGGGKRVWSLRRRIVDELRAFQLRLGSSCDDDGGVQCAVCNV